MEKRTYDFITYLKAIAAMLILNSHFDRMYPIPALATGGAIGNALFFAVSGFCLHPVDMPLKKWFSRRLVRLYLPTVLMTVISVFTYYSVSLSVIDILHVFLWPTIFWFVGAMVVFYLLFFLLKGVETNRQYAAFFAVTLSIYIICYLQLDTSVWVIESKGLLSFEGEFKLIYYFAAMMIGKWFRIHSESRFPKTTFYMVQIIAAFFTLYGGKYLINRSMFLMHFQFINQISIIWMIIAIFKFALSCEAGWRSYFPPILRKTAFFLSRITLEIYLVQFLVIHYTENIVFPINIILAVVSVVILAELLKKISGIITERVLDEKNRNRNFISQ